MPSRPPSQQRDARQIGVAQLAGGGGDAAQHGVEIERGVDGPGQLAEQLGLPPPLAGLGVEPGVLQGGRGVIGQRLGQPHLVGREDAPEPIAHREGADDPPLDLQRHRQHGAERGRAPSSARAPGGRASISGSAEHVGGRHRPAPLDRAARPPPVPRGSTSPGRSAPRSPDTARQTKSRETGSTRKTVVALARSRPRASSAIALGHGVEVEALGEDPSELGDGLGLAPARLLERRAAARARRRSACDR